MVIISEHPWTVNSSLWVRWCSVNIYNPGSSFGVLSRFGFKILFKGFSREIGYKKHCTPSCVQLSCSRTWDHQARAHWISTSFFSWDHRALGAKHLSRHAKTIMHSCLCVEAPIIPIFKKKVFALCLRRSSCAEHPNCKHSMKVFRAC